VEEAAAAGRQFDVVLMDMCMPVLGGVEATQVRTWLLAGQAVASAAVAIFLLGVGCGACTAAAPSWLQLASTPTRASHLKQCSLTHPALANPSLPQEIRALGCTLPIVAMTANASERDRVECIAAGMDAAGMDGFLSKPVLKEQLSVAIREAIQGGHRQ
jgi:CheY-like chemotaxis protein